MKLRNILIIVLIAGLGFLFFNSLPMTASAQSPSATLTIDGEVTLTFDTVQEAINAVTANAGTNFVIEVASGTVSEQLNISQQLNKNVVLKPQEGATVTFTRTINIDGGPIITNPETLLIQGFNFDFAESVDDNCIYLKVIPPRSGFPYSHNITINGCHFKGEYNRTVAVQSEARGIRNIAIMNCTATDMHSLAQLKAVAGYAFIQNCVVTNADSGVNFYGTADLYVDSCNFEVAGYAVRSGQSSDPAVDTGSVNINNSIFKTNSAEDGTVILRGSTTKNIRIIHSELTNANEDGAVLQNVTPGNYSLYKITVIETDLSGEIDEIDPATITVIDDPNVKNGPIFINENGNGSKIITIIVTIFIIIVLLVLIIVFSWHWWVIFL